MKQETLNLIGQKLSGNLILSLRVSKHSKTMVTCKCGACGTVFETYLSRLKNGSTKSCGCLQKNALAEINTTHGPASHKHYSRAHSVFRRCNNPKYHNFKNYGARGIECRFADIVELINYLDNLPGYFEGATVDRINNSGHYEKGNLRWASLGLPTDNQN